MLSPSELLEPEEEDEEEEEDELEDNLVFLPEGGKIGSGVGLVLRSGLIS